MATLRQKELAQSIVKNAKATKKKNKKELLVSVGYSEITAKANPEVIISGVGVQEELKALGFDEDSAKKVVGEILLDETIEPKDRLKAAGEIFKVSGSYAPEKRVNFNVTPIYGNRSNATLPGYHSDQEGVSVEEEDSSS